MTLSKFGITELDNLIDFMLTGRPFQISQSVTYPPLDVFTEDGDSKLTLEFAVAGFKKDEIKIELQGHKLYVASDREAQSSDNKNYLHKRIATRDFNIMIPIPEQFNLEDVCVTFVDGILRIEFEKLPNKKAKLLKIK